MMRGIHPVVLGGSLVAVLDLSAIFALRGAFGTSPLAVLQGIASGILGPSAFQGGATTATLGMALHVFIAFVTAAVYYAGSRWWPVLVRRPVTCGIAYGVVVDLVMNVVVLPLSRVTFETPPWYFIMSIVVIHILFVGLPIAFAVAGADDRYRKSVVGAGAISSRS